MRAAAFPLASCVFMAGASFAAARHPATGGDELAGYVAVPQIWDGVAEAFLIAPSGIWFAATSAGSKDIEIVDMASGTILRRLSAGGGTIRAGMITSDSQVVVVKLYDGRLLAWRAETGQPEAAPREVPPLQSFETGVAGMPKGPFSIRWSSGSDGRWIVDVSGGKPAMKPARLVLDDVQSAVDTPCGIEPSAAVFDGKHLLLSRKGGEDALEFSSPAAGFELKDGAFHELWQAPCDPGGGEVAADPRYFSIPSPAPRGPLTIWDLQTNRVLAHFEDSDGRFAMTGDGRVVVADGFKDETKLFRIHRDNRTTVLPRRIDDVAALALSPNGRWLAAKIRPDRTDIPDSVAVISMADGRQTKTVAAPRPSVGIASFKVANDGGVSVVFGPGEDASEEIDGRQVVARSDDRHWAELSDGKSAVLVLDTRRHRLVARLHERIERFTRDGRYAVTGENVVFDLVAQRPVWRIQGAPDGTGYVMLFADGCVQTSPGAGRDLKLVRGFDIRPYDALATSLFAKPGCKGRPDAVAASEAAIAKDQTVLAAIARKDEDDRIRARNAATEDAMRKATEAEAQRRADEATRRTRSKIDGLWAHPETLLSGGLQRAALTNGWPAAMTPGRTTTCRGTVSWNLAERNGVKRAVGRITLPDCRSHATITVSLARSADGARNGIIDIVFQPDRPDFGLHVQSIAIPRGRATFKASGDDLDASVASVAPNAFHIDLHGRAGIDRLLAANWIDVPLMESGLEGKLTFETGVEGQRVIAQALAPSP